MPRRRGPRAGQVVRDVLLVSVGGRLARVRIARRVTQRELSDASGVSQAAISMIERGLMHDVTLGTIAALCEPLDVSLDVTMHGPMMRGLEGQSDIVHAHCVEAIAALLRWAGWDTRIEVPVGSGRYLGFVDVLAYHPDEHVLMVIEVKTRLDDVGDLLRTMAWYRSEAIPAAKRLGWSPERCRSALVVLASDEVDRALLGHQRTVDRAFPVRDQSFRQWLLAPDPTSEGDVVVAIDPLSGDLVPLLIDGRDAEAPYIDYAHAARILSAPRPA